MKKIIIFCLFIAFVFSYNLSLAESYPASCPAEAQGVLNAVGGCATIDCAAYSNICAKCCVKVIPTSTLIIYVFIAAVIITLVIWQILKRRKAHE